MYHHQLQPLLAVAADPIDLPTGGAAIAAVVFLLCFEGLLEAIYCLCVAATAGAALQPYPCVNV